MFVYIFCIVWATFFVFLAERQFKKVQIEEGQNKCQSRTALRKKKKKNTPPDKQEARSQITTATQAKHEMVNFIKENEQSAIRQDIKINALPPVVILPEEHRTPYAHERIAERDETMHEHPTHSKRKTIAIMQHGNELQEEPKDVKGAKNAKTVKSAKVRIVGNEISRRKKADGTELRVSKESNHARPLKSAEKKTDYLRSQNETYDGDNENEQS